MYLRAELQHRKANLHENWHFYMFFHREGLCADKSVVTPLHGAVEQKHTYLRQMQPTTHSAKF